MSPKAKIFPNASSWREGRTLMYPAGVSEGPKKAWRGSEFGMIPVAMIFISAAQKQYKKMRENKGEGRGEEAMERERRKWRRER